jgi:uncharacterized protein YegP (UPF0339 family)
MRFIVFKDEPGVYRWHAVAPNGRKVATCGEGFHSRSNAIRAVRRFIASAGAFAQSDEPIDVVDE